MKNALKRIGWLITTQINPERIRSKTISQLDIAKWLDVAIEEYDNNYLMLMDACIGDVSETELRSMLHRYQYSLVFLLNRISSYQANPQGAPLTELYETLRQMLDDLLNNIRNNYRHYFDKTCKLPDHFYQNAKTEISEKWIVLNRAIINKKVPSEITIPTLKPIWLFVNTTAAHILTYEFHEYVTVIVDELLEWLKKDFKNPSKSLRQMAVYLNINSEGMGKSIVDSITAELNKLETYKDIMEHLEARECEFNLMTFRSELAYKSTQKPLKDRILGWIQTEMKLRKFQYRQQISAEAEIIMAEGFKKLKTPMTVVEMANFALALMELGIIDERPKIEVFRAFSACFESKQQDDMSAESMLKKYKNIDANSMDVLKDIGIRLYNYIKEQKKGRV